MLNVTRSKAMSKGKIAVLCVFAILIVDQLSKFWIKTNMFLGQEFPVFGNWFIIHFTENNGMAFGFEFAGNYGKYALSIFRIFAAIAIGWYIYHLIRKNAPVGVVIFMSFILAGAVGNIIDSAFYGLLFSDSYYQLAQFLPESGGYSSFLQGRVVDMLYFPIIQGHYPSWFPLWSNQELIFFRPVFNIADSAITTGVLCLLVFQRKYFKD